MNNVLQKKSVKEHNLLLKAIKNVSAEMIRNKYGKLLKAHKLLIQAKITSKEQTNSKEQDKSIIKSKSPVELLIEAKTNSKKQAKNKVHANVQGEEEEEEEEEHEEELTKSEKAIGILEKILALKKILI